MQQSGADEHRLSIRLTTAQSERFHRACEGKNVSQQAAVVALLELFSHAPEPLQAQMVVPMRDAGARRAVARAVLEYLASRWPKDRDAGAGEVRNPGDVRGSGGGGEDVGDVWHDDSTGDPPADPPSPPPPERGTRPRRRPR